MIIKEDFEIKNYTTFKIGGRVKSVYFPESEQEFTELMQKLDEYIVLGGCSNVLFSSDGYDGNLVMTTELKEYNIKNSEVQALCGVRGPLLAQKTCEANLSGFEFMIGFPGSIGGEIYMNAGAHGQTISDFLVSCTLFDKINKCTIVMNRDEMEFGYRKSILQNSDYVLISAKFKLEKKSKNEIESKINENLNFRKNIQPSLKYPNAGSVFKNPENNSAGRLLDMAGAKEFNDDNVCVWNNHANFIVNKKNASSKEVLNLMLKMHNSVKEQFNVDLIPEILYIGNRSKDEELLWNMLYKTKTQK